MGSVYFLRIVLKKQKGLIKTMSHKKVPKKYFLNPKAKNM